MNIKKTIITATVALTMVAMIAPGLASADTLSDLQAQINALMAQLAALQGGGSQTTGTPAACAGITFTRNLTVGSTGSDVKCLQALMNAHGYVLATSGAGSPGNETMYFGPKTLAKVQALQAAQGWTPAGQVGPMTRGLFNSWLNGGGVVITPPGQTPPPVTTGPVGVMLSSDNPAAGSIVSNSTTTAPGQAAADLLHVTFTGSGTVTSVTLKRSGISDQNTLSNVYVYDGNTRITDGYSFNVNGDIVINGLSVMVNGSHTVSVRGDVAANAAATASTIAVALVGYTANGNTNTVNIVGNQMFIVVGNLASATITTAASSAVPTANVNAGTTAYTFWSAPLQVNTRAVWLKMANFRMVGSAPSDALGNIRMFIDGVDTGKVGTVMTINGSSYAVFDLTSAPISLATGSHTLDMRADVQKGTNRTIQVSIQQASDLAITDPQLNVNVPVSSTTAGSFSANSAGTITILTGSATVVVDPTFNSQTNIPGGSANAVIAKFKIHAYGEDLKVNSLNVVPAIYGATSTGATCTTNSTTGVATGTCGLNNVTLYFNGSQIGSQVTYSSGSYTMGTVDGVGGTIGTSIAYTLGSQLIVPAGQDSYLEVRADLQTTASIAYTGGTLKVGIVAGSSNGQGMNSQATVNIPTAAVATTGLTIQSGGLQVSKNTAYLNQNIVPNMAGVKIGSYVIQNQSTSQSIRLTSYSIATTIATTTVSNFSALRTSDTTGSGSTPIQFSGTQSGTTSTDVFSVSDILAPGTTMTLDIFANTGSASNGTIATTLNVSSIGVVDNISATSGAKTGQTLTLGTGTLSTPTLVVSSTTPAQYIAAGANGATSASQATFNFVSTSGASTITELAFQVSGSDANPTQTITQVCVGTVCASPVTVSSTQLVDITGLNLAVPNAGAGFTQPVLVSYSGVGTSGVTPGSTSTLSLAYMRYTTGGSPKTLGSTTVCTALGVSCTSNISVVDANAETLVGSKPTVVVSSGGATGMIINTSTKVGQVTITADSKGDIKLRQLNFVFGYSGYGTAPTSIASAFLALGGQTTAISGVTCTVVGTTTNVVCKTTTNGGTFAYSTDLPISAGASQQFDLYATTAGGVVSTNGTKSAISTTLYNAAGADTTSTAATTSAFLWDDTSNNGGSGSSGLTGLLIYGFPLNGYAVSQ